MALWDKFGASAAPGVPGPGTWVGVMYSRTSQLSNATKISGHGRSNSALETTNQKISSVCGRFVTPTAPTREISAPCHHFAKCSIHRSRMLNLSQTASRISEILLVNPRERTSWILTGSPKSITPFSVPGCRNRLKFGRYTL